MGDLIDLAVVILPTVIALLSTYVSIKIGKGQKHALAWALAVILGIGTSALTWESQSRNRKQHNQEQAELRQQLKDISAIVKSGALAHTVPITAPVPGNFHISHGLGCIPQEGIIQMTSLGFIGWQSPTKKYDDTNLYLVASDSGLTADVLVWCQR